MGSERSGGNLLTQMLNAHSQISAPSPSHLVRALLNNHKKYGDLSDDSNWQELIGNIVELCNSQLGEWSQKFDVTKLSNAIVDRSPQSIISHIYRCEAQGLFHHFIKENKTYEYFDELLDCFPKCKLIYLVRDPRDVVLSYLKSPNHKGRLEEAATLWNDEQCKFQQIIEQHNAKIITVRYEDLIANTSVELARICDFMGLEFEDNMLHYYQSENVQANADRITDWNNLGKNVITNNSRKFEKELGSQQIKTIERICQESMANTGYQPMNNYPQVEETIITKKELTQGEVEIRNKRLAAVKKFVERGQAV